MSAGCLSGKSGVISSSTESSSSSTAYDAPKFEVDNVNTAKPILLTSQIQTSDGIELNDKFDIAIAIGNAGGKKLSGKIELILVPPKDAQNQIASVTIDRTNSIPSGAAKFFKIGSFNATVTGTWALVAGDGISQVHRDYDGKFKVDEV